MVDAYSKWIEVYPTSSTSATATMEKLRQAFATHGLPEMVVSDNGSGYTSEEFGEFMAGNEMLHVKTAPPHPSSNGLAERSVRIFEEGMKKMDIDQHLRPLSTGVAPAELMFNHRLRTRLDLIRPDIRQRVETRQLSQKGQHDNTRKERQFSDGDRVLVNNFNPGLKWKNAHIESRTGPLSYTVKYEDGVVACRHVDHLLKNMVCPLLISRIMICLNQPYLLSKTVYFPK